RRKLLLVYIHGFMGAETSFRSFPAHVHNLLAILLSETHVVHSKIYPRYRSKGRISNARDDFSRWLSPHEDNATDTVLLGHSMGGLLSAEVALMPPEPPSAPSLKHRIIGTINFDVPFLGMHPGVVKSGLSSIFKPAEETDDKYFETTNTLWAPESADPNYNPSFQNDVVLPVRKGWRNAWHFINKHSDDLTKATKKLVSSHLEFGGAMANYNELKSRYARLRALEEADERVRRSVVQSGTPPRVRFINYYTASTESEMSHSEKEELRLERERQRMEKEGRRLRGEPEPESSQLQPHTDALRPPQNSRSSSIAAISEPTVVHDTDSLAPSETRGHESRKPKKDRMFCSLPPKDSHGERDPTWVRVFMENVDEVGAHCGLFFVDERYERLVGDVATRIESWV
ncbi:uncharacterized protein MYCFIDRAFT_118736, partial [Pseudocercospora fijiensis CIRAD86]